MFLDPALISIFQSSDAIYPLVDTSPIISPLLNEEPNHEGSNLINLVGERDSRQSLEWSQRGPSPQIH